MRGECCRRYTGHFRPSYIKGWVHSIIFNAAEVKLHLIRKKFPGIVAFLTYLDIINMRGGRRCLSYLRFLDLKALMIQ